MAPRKRSESAPEVPGCAPHERRDWLLPIPQLGWYEELREAHAAAVAEFERAVQAAGEIEVETEEAQRSWRRSIRDAVAAGEEPPARPFDPAIQRAQREVAEEDVAAARDALSRVVVDVLAACRTPEHRVELDPYEGRLSEPLRRSLMGGPEGVVETARARLREQLAALNEARSGGIVDITDPDAQPLTEREEANVVSTS